MPVCTCVCINTHIYAHTCILGSITEDEVSVYSLSLKCQIFLFHYTLKAM